MRLFLLLLACILIAGCETLWAVKTGDVSGKDMAEMAKTGSKGTLLNTDTLKDISEGLSQADKRLQELAW